MHGLELYGKRGAVNPAIYPCNALYLIHLIHSNLLLQLLTIWYACCLNEWRCISSRNVWRPQAPEAAPEKATNRLLRLPKGHLHISSPSAAFCFSSALDGWESASWSVNAISLLWTWKTKKKEKKFANKNSESCLCYILRLAFYLKPYQFCKNDQRVCQHLVNYLFSTKGKQNR